MSRRRRIGPAEAERLLATGRDPAHPELSRLLTAVTARPRARELARLREAVAAFEEAGRLPRHAAAPRRRRALRPFALAAGVAALLAGGVAVAAQTGDTPGPGASPARSHTTGTSPDSTLTPQAHSASPTSTASPPSVVRGPTLSPTNPTAVGLCQAWDAQRRNPTGAPMAVESVRDLVAAAGGEDRVPAFCDAALSGTARPRTLPPTPSHPSGKGTGKPTPSSTRKG